MQTSWQLGEVSLWQGADQYTQTGACGLLEFGRAWNLPPNSLIPRTTAHFLSGKNNNSGIAWVGVLCNAPFTTSPANLGTTCNAPVSGTGLYGGAYGFTAGIDGNFNLDNPTVVWDILAYTPRDRPQLQLAAHPLLPEPERQRRLGRQLQRRPMRHDRLLLRHHRACRPAARAPARAAARS